MNDPTVPISRPACPRRDWKVPRIVRHGSVRRLVRGASGPLGDSGAGGVGKRARPTL